MKKRAIVLLAFTAALTAVSCQKEDMKEAESTPAGEGMTISAVTEGIGAAAKADLAYKYDVIWRTGDKICVKNSEKSVEFTLVGGAGTTKGTFSSTGGNISGEVEGFYPASVANLIWPAEQQNNQVPPMYSKKNLTSTQNQTFNFTSLGSVLQLTFSTTSENVILKSIEVKADQAMSGAFTINEGGQAVISQPEGDKPGVTLELGDTGVALGVTAKKFNIAIPAGTYTNLTITFIAKDGQKCTKHATKAQSIEYNTVNTLAVSGKFRPAGALPGVFTVSDPDGTPNSGDEKQVYFSKGNLWANASSSPVSLHFEANQYSSASSWDASHVSHFTWSDDVAVAVGNSIHGNNLFTNDPNDEKKANSDFKVKVGDIEQSGWRTLTTAEWQYLLDTRTVNGGTGEGKSYQRAMINSDATGVFGMILYPDNYTGTAKTFYTNAEWASLEAAGCVFLPAAGYRDGSSVDNVGGRGRYWSSTAYDFGNAYYVRFSSNGSVSPDDSEARSCGNSVRLITESN